MAECPVQGHWLAQPTSYLRLCGRFAHAWRQGAGLHSGVKIVPAYFAMILQLTLFLDDFASDDDHLFSYDSIKPLSTMNPTSNYDSVWSIRSATPIPKSNFLSIITVK